ncbi:MAG: phosphoglycerate dehydrogenase [Saccharofermentans sp.]|jgi:D-3-phosphoglycerate dehydrogenase|nr:phosphoglycerate dehydrogenase [Mageeibacillus sp.]MCI1264229.1 phosphoglycerate dehydrogenase [Saccharofermentans sp.]MCI1274974.1 phosphoglycerate dehydrogenase [Saccharofermentans sp.]MCI1770012.1 phosphoglycerate dehydrogenase [Mageeibacillus sp.]MCI2044260.1 phosphoglycerate dehydrogenase [Mageeibacillus sp.]
MKVLITESIAEESVQYLKDEGYEVEEYLGHSQEEIEQHIKGFDALIVRSATKVSPALLNNADCLKAVGRAGTGIDNIDVASCTEHGVIALNTPTANNTAAGELAVGHAFSIFRNICEANEGVHNHDFRRGNWVGYELEGKTVGIIGLGRIGSIVARKLKGVGMNAIAYDPYIPAEKFEKLGVKRCQTLDELLAESDLITLHTPKTKETYNIIAKEQLYKCKRGVRIVNAARGGLVNEQDLADALADGQVAAAAIDVFDKEPSYNKKPEDQQEFDNVLLHAPHCYITPHLGASTVEATAKVGQGIVELVSGALKGDLVAAINMPSFSGSIDEIKPYCSLAQKIGLMYYQAEATPIKKVEVRYRGELAENSGTGIITLSLVMGLLKGMGNDHVSYVNAQESINECGIEVVETKTDSIQKYNNLINVKFFTEDGRELKINGTVFGPDTEVIVSFFGYEMNCPLSSTVLAIKNNDVPGVIGRIATILGKHNINICSMHWGRKNQDGSDNQHAQAFVAVEQPVTQKIMDEIAAAEGVLRVSLLELD